MSSLLIQKLACGSQEQHLESQYTQILVRYLSPGEVSIRMKHCERYIVEQNIWKRLPELKEAKFSVSMCFFNNGSTLYCFGGPSQFIPTNTIERLSKG
jgi:hypothetical protein